MTSKKVFSIQDLSGDSKRLLEILNEESSLSSVLIASSFLDNCLASMLKAAFIKTSITKKLLNPSRGAVGTFAARRDLARCLGLIDKVVYQDLEIIGDIRNLFAHSHLSIDFSHEKVVSKSNSLKFAEFVLKIMASHHTDNDLTEIDTTKFISARDRFNTTVALLSQKLLVDGLSIGRKKIANLAV